MDKTKSINRITLYNILSMVILQGITFFTAPIISRMLGTDHYGIASVYVTWVSLCSTIFGLQTQSTIALFKIDNDELEQKKYNSSILFLSLVSYTLFSLPILLFLNSISLAIGLENSIIIVLLAHGFGQFIVTFVTTKFTYEFKAKWNLIITVVISLSTTCLSIILIRVFPSSHNYWGRIIGLSAPYVILGAALCFIVFLQGKTLFNKHYWKYCIVLCLPIVIHNVSNLILNQSDRVMIKGILDNSQAGIYSLAYSFATVVSVLWVALNNSWVPFYYQLSKDGQSEAVVLKTNNIMELFTVLATGFLLLAPEVYRVFASEEFWGGIDLIPVFVIGFYFMFMYSFPVNYEFLNKKTKVIAFGTISAAIVNILLNFVLIKIIGIYGAAISTAVSFFLQFLFHYICSMHISKKTPQYANPLSLSIYVKHFIIMFIFVCIFYASKDFPRLRWSYGALLGLFELLRIFKRRTIY